MLFLLFLRQIFTYKKYSKHINKITNVDQSLEVWPQNSYEDPIARSPNQSNKSLVNETESKAINQKQLKKVFKIYVCCLIPFLLGNLSDAIGYIARVALHFDKTSRGFYTKQAVFLLVGPAFMAATIYILFGKLVVLLNGEKYSPIKINYLTSFFVAIDFISLIIQSVGAGVSGGSDADKVNTGLWVVFAGLLIQVLLFVLLIIIDIRFVYMMSKEPTDTSIEMRHSPSKVKNWKAVNILLIVSSLLIMVRSIFRMVEYAEGSNGNGAIWKFETYLFALDGGPIAMASILFILFSPLNAILALYFNQQNIKEFPH